MGAGDDMWGDGPALPPLPLVKSKTPTLDALRRELGELLEFPWFIARAVGLLAFILGGFALFVYLIFFTT